MISYTVTTQSMSPGSGFIVGCYQRHCFGNPRGTVTDPAGEEEDYAVLSGSKKKYGQAPAMMGSARPAVS